MAPMKGGTVSSDDLLKFTRIENPKPIKKLQITISLVLRFTSYFLVKVAETRRDYTPSLDVPSTLL
jgi:hypothetical protein